VVVPPLGSIIETSSPYVALISNETSYTYDSAERLAQVTDPLGGVTSNTYDSMGRMMTSTDAAGVKTTNTPDASSSGAARWATLQRTCTIPAAA
jgi:YD repeat-containing protein